MLLNKNDKSEKLSKVLKKNLRRRKKAAKKSANDKSQK